MLASNTNARPLRTGAQKGLIVSDLTNGRYRVPVPLVYIDEPVRIVRVRNANRRASIIRRVRGWR
jgi:hypothetical protein